MTTMKSGTRTTRRAPRLRAGAGALAIVLALGVGLSAEPALADNDVGCGVGTEIWKGNEGLVYKILASSTNGMTFQSISITFGLINCNGRDTVTASARVRHFVDHNLDRLARDASRGEGESLAALASLLGVRADDRPAFYELARVRFDTLFPSDRVTSEEVLWNLATELSQDARLAVYVQS